jgi:multidrug resistance efflux pump
MRTAFRLVLVAALLGASGWYYAAQSRPAVLVLTGAVTTNDVVVAPQIGGRIAALHVEEGDAVTAGQVLAEIEPGELAADRDYYAHSAESLESAVREQQASLRLQRRQLQEQETQAEASIGTAVASQADAERAKLTFERTRDLAAAGLAPAQQLDEARTAYAAAQARVESTPAPPARRRPGERLDPRDA